MRLKYDKCAFLLPAVEYLGHKISAHGLQPTDFKVQAIKNAPAPTDVSQLKSFLSLVNYYCKFLPNLSNTLAPLYRKLQKNAKWIWGSEEQKAFQTAKESLTSDSVLVHFDPKRTVILACDASPYGIGAVLSHRMDDGTDQPIAFASRTLAAAEKKYSQIEKEGFAIIFGVKRFHQYLFGRQFTILSDHKPLKHLFSESQATPTLASARIQRWSLTLVRPVNNATSTVTIDQLHSIFATHGLPEMLVTDNGTVFTSDEFSRFTKQNSIRHVRSAPYHPASNGLVERAVQTFKDFMKKMKDGSVEVNVSRFLLQYRITPHSTTGISPDGSTSPISFRLGSSRHE